jgi:hypothetical protein
MSTSLSIITVFLSRDYGPSGSMVIIFLVTIGFDKKLEIISM